MALNCGFPPDVTAQMSFPQIMCVLRGEQQGAPHTNVRKSVWDRRKRLKAQGKWPHPIPEGV